MKKTYIYKGKEIVLCMIFGKRFILSSNKL